MAIAFRHRPHLGYSNIVTRQVGGPTYPNQPFASQNGQRRVLSTSLVRGI